MSTFNITSVQTKQNLAVDRSKDDVVTLCGANPSEKLQVWFLHNSIFTHQLHLLSS